MTMREHDGSMWTKEQWAESGSGAQMYMRSMDRRFAIEDAVQAMHDAMVYAFCEGFLSYEDCLAERTRESDSWLHYGSHSCCGCDE